ncbi:glycine cleavage system protein GcvH [Actinomyces vulturis]|uniref:glycine cleavage system protein GcvH n=1 Tax=Actinomyces vulturis TaxID=1857645 RepID=UPI000829C186|nr:glycine cleavage system protein GcvH [Actinomyces vulturis]
MSKQPVLVSLFYSEEHEWLTTDERARVGVSAVAADALGEVVFVELPEPGSEVSAGEPCGELESTKSVSDLYSPVSGKVVDINDDVVDDPSLVNSDPYGAGWLFTVDVSERGELMDANTYAQKFDAEVVESL